MSEKIGVITAGGKGSRLGLPYNKHQALVYDRTMISYPIEAMEANGWTPMIVTNPEDGFIVSGYEHVVQQEPRGMPDAILKAMGSVTGNFAVLAGDVYFDPLPELPDEPTLIWHEFQGAKNHTVWNPETNEFVEKPTRDIGSRAIVAYVFDQNVFEVIGHSKLSARGELEMTDIYKYYLANGARMLEYKGFFSDMGTPEGLLRVANHVSQKSNQAN